LSWEGWRRRKGEESFRGKVPRDFKDEVRRREELEGKRIDATNLSRPSSTLTSSLLEKRKVFASQI